MRSCRVLSMVGSQRLSRVSVSRKTTSWALINASSCSVSRRACSISACTVSACPGMGIVSSCAAAFTPGKMRRSAAAAASALGLPPSAQSANSKSDWRTGLEYETRPLSTNVTLRTPHPSRQRATLQPSVPAPRRRQRVEKIRSVSRSGSSRQRMSLRLRSTDDSASRRGSITALRSICRGPFLPRAFVSHPTAAGTFAVSSAAARLSASSSSTSSAMLRSASSPPRPVGASPASSGRRARR
mmetsp:Transcript_32296/g.84850  ORF Transcript_32296/g.84850 Transcript_32296/m.84850 type:complete len:242 (-) Transcript_32296:278-1003(-)